LILKKLLHLSTLLDSNSEFLILDFQSAKVLAQEGRPDLTYHIHPTRDKEYSAFKTGVKKLIHAHIQSQQQEGEQLQQQEEHVQLQQQSIQSSSQQQPLPSTSESIAVHGSQHFHQQHADLSHHQNHQSLEGHPQGLRQQVYDQPKGDDQQDGQQHIQPQASIYDFV
jgi:hypothetical protein